MLHGLRLGDHATLQSTVTSIDSGSDPLFSPEWCGGLDSILLNDIPRTEAPGYASHRCSSFHIAHGLSL